MKVTLIQQTLNPVNFIAKIASTCYDSDPANPAGMVKHLYRNGHHSVFEHVVFTFQIEGISRACSHQLVRHRHTSPTQRSQRYCAEDNFEVVAPESVAGLQAFWDVIEAANDAYYALTKKHGVPNEDARAVLPNACATKMVVTLNLRELIHFCNFRCCARAQKEIRDLAYAMRAAVPEALRWMLVPKCLAPYYNCLEKRTEACNLVKEKFN